MWTAAGPVSRASDQPSRLTLQHVSSVRCHNVRIRHCHLQPFLPLPYSPTLCLGVRKQLLKFFFSAYFTSQNYVRICRQSYLFSITFHMIVLTLHDLELTSQSSQPGKCSINFWDFPTSVQTLSINYAPAAKPRDMTIEAAGVNSMYTNEYDEQKLEAFHISCQRQIQDSTGITWSAMPLSPTRQVKTASVAGSAANAWQSFDMSVNSAKMFQHMSHSVRVSLTVKARSGRQPAHCSRSCDRPCHSWTTQIKLDSGHCADLVWDMADDRWRWRALRPIAGQVDQWVSEAVRVWCCIIIPDANSNCFCLFYLPKNRNPRKPLHFYEIHGLNIEIHPDCCTRYYIQLDCRPNYLTIRHVRKTRICDCHIFGTLWHFSHILAKCTYRIFWHFRRH